MLKFRWETEFKETGIGRLKTQSENNYYIFTQGVHGKIPRDWEMKKISEDYNVNTGNRISPTSEGLIPVYGANGFSGYSEGFMINEAAIVTGRVGTIGQVFCVDGKVNISDNALYITKKNDEAVLNFLYYAMKFVFKNVKEVLNVGTSQPLIKQSEVKRFSVPFPDFTEQSLIATVLSWLDNLLKNKERQNEILEETAVAIFKSWFIDLEPFKHIEFKPNELGEIPKGWDVRPIGEIADLRNGFSYAGKEKYNEPIEKSHVFITLNNVIEGGGFKPEYSWIKSDRLKDHHFLDEGDLILTNTHFGVGGSEVERLLATPAIVFFPHGYNERKGVYSHHITKISPKNPNYRLFLYLFLKITKEESVSFATGTGVLGLDLDNFKQNKIVLCPPEPVLEKFASLVQPLFQKIVTNKKQVMVLIRIRDTILPLLVSGKLRVEEI